MDTAIHDQEAQVTSHHTDLVEIPTGYVRYVYIEDSVLVVYWRKILLVLFGLPLLVGTVVASVALLRTIAFRASHASLNDQLRDEARRTPPVHLIDEARAMEMAERLAGALRIPTVSYERGNQNYEEFIKLHDYLAASFPLVHRTSFVTREVVNGYSLLYTVQGTNAKLVPYLLCSHLDVVPANESAWEQPPFAGNIVDGTYVYGRGAIDDKLGALGILEALEYMIKTNKGKPPNRTFYIAFGHDEEIGGMEGAQMIAGNLTAKGVKKLDFLVDEGLPLTEGIFPGMKSTLAMIGVTEKGSVTLELSVRGTPAHSSFPYKDSAIVILARAVTRLEDYPQPSMFLRGPEAKTFAEVAPYCSFGYRYLFQNLWLFSGLVSYAMSRKPVTDSLVRTTTAVTMFHGGEKDNVMPSLASAIVNLRIHPAQTVTQVVDHVRTTIDDPRVRIHQVEGTIRQPHPVSPSSSADAPYRLIATTVKQVFPDVLVLPGVVMGNTDTRWYLSYTNNVYRMFPVVLRPADIDRIHGDNERITVAAYRDVVNFYYRLMVNADPFMAYTAPSVPTTLMRRTEL